jgi:hypothetical protein
MGWRIQDTLRACVPPITLLEVVKNDLLIKEAKERMILDMIEWWRKINVGHPYHRIHG